MEALPFGLLFIQRFLQMNTTSVCLPQRDVTAFTESFLFDAVVQKNDYLPVILSRMADRDIVHVSDPVKVGLSLVRIGDQICIIGPYITATQSREETKRLFRQAKIDEAHLEAFSDYLAQIPLQPIATMSYATHTLLQGVIGMDSKASVYYVNLHESKSVRLLAESAGTPVSAAPQQLYSNVVSARDNAELLHRLETMMTDQMKNGQTANALKSLAQIEKLYGSGTNGEKDLDTMRINSAVLCTLMRINAMQAGVLPVLAEIRSRHYLSLFKTIATMDEISQVRQSMLAQFCDLIRKQKLDSLSPKIRKTVQFIMADLSGDLSIENLAAQVSLSPNYLSACFKKEMNQQLSSYIREKRLESAAHFLIYTNMSIRDIAVCVGISDFSYFTKRFGEKYGMTPSKYRSHK